MPLILGTNSIKDTGFDVANSCRFNDGSSDHLKRTIGSNGSKRTFTFSAWIKRGELSSYNPFFGHISDSSNDYFAIGFNNSDQIFAESIASGNNQLILKPNRLFRDTSAWYHVVVKVDTTQATESNRAKMYINGVEETSFATQTIPSQNSDIDVNVSGEPMVVGGMYDPVNSYFDGYMAEVVFIDGTALTPTDFGEFDEDSGIWKPIDVSGLTFGTNGFYLDFEDSSALGNDVSGNNNDFTVNNLTAIDQSTDTCTNNSSNINALSIGSGVTLSEGNLQVLMDASAQFGGHSTIGVSTGKWYCEIKYSARTDADRLMLGISGNPNLLAYASPFGSGAGYVGGAQEPTSYGYYSDGGNSFNNDNSSSYGASYTVGDIIGIALDLDNNKLYFSKNGTFQNSGDPTSGSTGTGAISIGAASGTNTGNYFFAVSESSGSYGHTAQCNFGSPAYSISSGNTDGNGYGNFEYSVPSGYYSLNTKNLSEFG